MKSIIPTEVVMRLGRLPNRTTCAFHNPNHFFVGEMSRAHPEQTVKLLVNNGRPSHLRTLKDPEHSPNICVFPNDWCLVGERYVGRRVISPGPILRIPKEILGSGWLGTHAVLGAKTPLVLSCHVAAVVLTTLPMGGRIHAIAVEQENFAICYAIFASLACMLRLSWNEHICSEVFLGLEDSVHAYRICHSNGFQHASTELIVWFDSFIIKQVPFGLLWHTALNIDSNCPRPCRFWILWKNFWSWVKMHLVKVWQFPPLW